MPFRSPCLSLTDLFLLFSQILLIQIWITFQNQSNSLFLCQRDILLNQAFCHLLNLRPSTTCRTIKRGTHFLKQLTLAKSLIYCPKQTFDFLEFVLGFSMENLQNLTEFFGTNRQVFKLPSPFLKLFFDATLLFFPKL